MARLIRVEDVEVERKRRREKNKIGGPSRHIYPLISILKSLNGTAARGERYGCESTECGIYVGTAR
jgi:hypothetical protein